MINLRSLILGSALLAAIGTSAAFPYTQNFDPGNRPAPGAKAAPDYTTTGQGLGMAILGAEIASDASIITGIGVTSSSHISTGQYEVDFNRDVSKCIYNITPFNYSTSLHAQPRSTNVNGVFIAATYFTSNFMDTQFYISVFCNQ